MSDELFKELMAITQVPINRIVTIKWLITIKMVANIYLHFISHYLGFRNLWNNQPHFLV
jgi:hypothetical protein